MIRPRHTYAVVPAQRRNIVGRILESDILDDSIGYKYPTYGLLPKEAQAVYDGDLKLWQAFYRADVECKVHGEYLPDRSGVGWYKIHSTLKKAAPQIDLALFEATYAALAAKLEPLVYGYGFLKE